jgi:hypothetical protein
MHYYIRYEVRAAVNLFDAVVDVKDVQTRQLKQHQLLINCEIKQSYKIEQRI